MKADQWAMKQRGNHKFYKMTGNSKDLLTEMEEEIKMGWSLPLAIDPLGNIGGAGLVLLGVTYQYSICKEG